MRECGSLAHGAWPRSSRPSSAVAPKNRPAPRVPPPAHASHRARRTLRLRQLGLAPAVVRRSIVAAIAWPIGPRSTYADAADRREPDRNRRRPDRARHPGQRAGERMRARDRSRPNDRSRSHSCSMVAAADRDRHHLRPPECGDLLALRQQPLGKVEALFELRHPDGSIAEFGEAIFELIDARRPAARPASLAALRASSRSPCRSAPQERQEDPGGGDGREDRHRIVDAARLVHRREQEDQCPPVRPSVAPRPRTSDSSALAHTGVRCSGQLARLLALRQHPLGELEAILEFLQMDLPDARVRRCVGASHPARVARSLVCRPAPQVAAQPRDGRSGREQHADEGHAADGESCPAVIPVSGAAVTLGIASRLASIRSANSTRSSSSCRRTVRFELREASRTSSSSPRAPHWPPCLRSVGPMPASSGGTARRTQRAKRSRGFDVLALHTGVLVRAIACGGTLRQHPLGELDSFLELLHASPLHSSSATRSRDRPISSLIDRRRLDRGAKRCTTARTIVTSSVVVHASEVMMIAVC